MTDTREEERGDVRERKVDLVETMWDRDVGRGVEEQEGRERTQEVHEAETKGGSWCRDGRWA